MSLGDEIRQAGARIVGRTPKVLTLDIERLKGQATVEFWSLGDFKGRRIHHGDVTLWPRTICAAYKWYGQQRVQFAAEWLDGGREEMFRTLWDAYDAADIVVGHNLDGFDTKHLKTAWRELGFGPPSPFKTVDTLKVARAQFGDESKTLDALCKRVGLAGKTDRYDHEVARRACEGHKPSQSKLKGYNCGDVLATEALYDALRPWISNHPHLGLYSGEERSCHACGSTDLTAQGFTTTAVTTYARFRCDNCGAWSRKNHRKGAVSMRGVR